MSTNVFSTPEPPTITKLPGVWVVYVKDDDVGNMAIAVFAEGDLERAVKKAAEIVKGRVSYWAFGIPLDNAIEFWETPAVEDAPLRVPKERTSSRVTQYVPNQFANELVVSESDYSQIRAWWRRGLFHHHGYFVWLKNGIASNKALEVIQDDDGVVNDWRTYGVYPNNIEYHHLENRTGLTKSVLYDMDADARLRNEILYWVGK